MTQTQSPISETPEEFDEVAQRYRRELVAHCYRMTGSVYEAEDMVQETYLRAWRAYDDFEGRSSVRTWLYRIATNVCLTNLEGKAAPTAARPGSARPARRPATSWSRPPRSPWLEPVPDVMVDVRRRRPGRSSAAATPSGSRSSPPCSTCRPGSAPC